MIASGETQSLCPICLKRCEAVFETLGDETYMVKTCSEHGTFKTRVWKGSPAMGEWNRPKIRATIAHPVTKVEKGCPYDCGLCEDHRQHTCTALIEVTERCNLHCRFCFADADASGQNPDADLPIETIRFQFEQTMKISGACNIQLSGGEPTVRDDLPEIVKIGREIGFKFIQVNTNGIRLAEDASYVRALKEAGLDSVFLQFDGTEDAIYKALRGRALFEVKKKAIENCAAFGIGVVLVPTLVPGINDHNIGEIVRFGMSKAPDVRSVHFQPVSYFGRVPTPPKDEDRITLPEVMAALQDQTQGMVQSESLKPPGCENALCSFHGNYMIEGDRLVQLTKRESCCCGGDTCAPEKAEEGAVKAIEFVSRNWSGNRLRTASPKESEGELSDWDRILKTIKRKSFSISAMAFQDVWNVNLERIKDCCIHVVTPEGKLIPFCMYNLTRSDGKTLYR
ncbi:MAG: 7,8-dihydro-6-hydroxymethylpterin dimethyltransferase [Clostridiales bacterium]|jgi:hypothetical protein|nr:7,8-dihydro-6-hydroxymethylpterin dimethyltransferase [Clostridiales bacterium]